MATQVTIIDDNSGLLTSLALQFQIHGYSAKTYSCPQDALDKISAKPSDIYVIDLKMPKLTGVEFYKALCKKFNLDAVPALFLTCVDTLEAKCLKETTIADYVLKGCDFEILLARVEKILSKSKYKEKVYTIGNLKLFDEKILCTWFDKEIELTKTEFSLLSYLAKRPRIIYTRPQLLDLLEKNLEVEDRVIDSHVKRIRHKFKKAIPKEKLPQPYVLMFVIICFVTEPPPSQEVDAKNSKLFQHNLAQLSRSPTEWIHL